MLGGEFEQVGQLAERTARAEVFGVGLEGLGIAGIDLQDGVQVDRRLFAVAQAVLVQLGQLAQQRQARLCLGGAFELLFA